MIKTLNKYIAAIDYSDNNLVVSLWSFNAVIDALVSILLVLFFCFLLVIELSKSFGKQWEEKNKLRKILLLARSILNRMEEMIL